MTVTIGPGVTGYVLLSGMQIAQASGAPDALPPVIISQPLSQSVSIGSSVTFQVLASGTPPFTCQWSFYGMALPDVKDAAPLLPPLPLDPRPVA